MTVDTDVRTEPLTASEQIAEFVCSFDADRLTDSHRLQCSRTFVDTFAVAVAGKYELASLSARKLVGFQGVGPGSPIGVVHGGARLWTDGTVTGCEAAALANGIFGHVLDYDDVTTPLRGHPSVVLWPALTAIGEARDLPGARFVAAYVVGFEVLCKLSRVMAVPHYESGWHSTASIGVIGATAACAYLLSLARSQVVNAIGLAVAQAAGCRENVGTQAKSFQAGQAAAAAVRAALFAEAEFEASVRSLDGAHGYMHLYAQDEELAQSLGELGDVPLEIERAGIEVKQYPMCYATHRTLDALLALRKDNELVLEDVRHVHVETSNSALVPLTRHRPVTGLEGKFSIEYAVAAALMDGAVRLDTFTDDAVNRASIQRFLACVESSEAEGALSPRWARVTLTLKNGRTVSRHIEILHGSAQDPLSDDELLRKVTDCLSFGRSDIDPQSLYDQAMNMHRVTVRELLDALTPRPNVQP
ncbi:MmgE/PrpD family protein [Paraburkholderia xenovorans]|uniref:MmgE/PrpD family protein n=1 Tax=Paraburkholderia xenovorans TaxID=36873 RepID=UPI0038BCCA21